MHREILPNVIFSPARLALTLANGLQSLGHEVTLYTPGPVETKAKKLTADLSYFERELDGRGDNYLDLLKKHPFTFVTLARQVQSELIANAYSAANRGELDIVHIYTNEEDIALPFASFCQRPVVFTHHDPFNFLVKYKNVFPKYSYLNWISMSQAQRQTMPLDTNWVGNIYHGLDKDQFTLNTHPNGRYIAYLGRIIESKGVHLAIAAVKKYNSNHPDSTYKLKIAGKHYAGSDKDNYWQTKILPQIEKDIEYVGFIKDDSAKQDFLGNATALIVPSIFNEPFGMVLIEALACGTPVIGLNNGAIPEVITNNKTGIIVKNESTENETITGLSAAISRIEEIDRLLCRGAFESRFTLDRMVTEHLGVYQNLVVSSKKEKLQND